MISRDPNTAETSHVEYKGKYRSWNQTDSGPLDRTSPWSGCVHGDRRKPRRIDYMEDTWGAREVEFNFSQGKMP